MIGVEQTENQGIHVVRLNYRADPDKRSAEWAEEAAIGMPGGVGGRTWRQQMENDWTVSSGLGVFVDVFDREAHVAKKPLTFIAMRPVIRGWDFGLTPACVFCQVSPAGCLNVLAELVVWNGRTEMRQEGIERFLEKVIPLSNTEFPGVQWEDWADPAGWAKSQTDEKTCVQIMHKAGVHPRKGPVTFTARRAAVNKVLDKRNGMLIDSRCRMLIEGFEGAYKYQEIGETGRYREEVEKNAWSHPMDALSYVVGGVFAAPPRDEGPRQKVGRSIYRTGY